MQATLHKDKIKVLLLEGVDPSAKDIFTQAGYNNIVLAKEALSDEALIEALRDTKILGIRSRSQVSQAVIEACAHLLAIGCFCIGTNQVDLDSAKGQGIPVFNAPYANTRSVAELVLGEMILLARKIPQKNALLHRGVWKKTVAGSHELRGKKLGIIGYGHIGSQLSILAEHMGMQVFYHDIAHCLPLGNAKSLKSKQELLETADVVSLHVPENKQTHHLIDSKALSMMKKDAILINASRGHVVDIDALAEALKDGHISGAAIDVFPKEPKTADEAFQSPLKGFDNVILTPHIGGSTREAQHNIGIEVATKLVHYSDNGTTQMAVNFPMVNLPHLDKMLRFLHVHHNQPGVLAAINEVFTENGANITGQYLQTEGDIGYVVMDIEPKGDAKTLLHNLKNIPGTIRSRMLNPLP